MTETSDAIESDARLLRLLGGEPIAWLVRRARDRLEAGRPLTGTVTLPDATPEQRRALERLTGRTARSGASLSVSLAEVDRILCASGVAPGGLAEAVTRLTGPLRTSTALEPTWRPPGRPRSRRWTTRWPAMPT